VGNAPTIRSLGCLSHFERELHNRLDNAMRVTFSLNIASLWLSIRLQLLGTFVATSLALSATLSTTFDLLPVSPGLLGLSLAYSLTIVNNLNGLVGSLTETEQEMISVERVLEYSNAIENEFSSDEHTTEQGGILAWIKKSTSFDTTVGIGDDGLAVDNGDLEAGHDEPLLSASSASTSTSYLSKSKPKHSALKLPSSWPTNGEISLKCVSMRYSEDLPYTLKQMSISIPAGSRVAIVGRTGSGKSSFLRVLLRMNAYSGSLCISGQELRDVAKKTVRRRLSIIPQDPFIFSGSLRLNLDPLGAYSDHALLDVLNKCHFAETFTDNSSNGNNVGAAAKSTVSAKDMCDASTLDLDLVGGGSILSLGQKQMVCLARALLRKSSG